MAAAKLPKDSSESAGALGGMVVGAVVNDEAGEDDGGEKEISSEHESGDGGRESRRNRRKCPLEFLQPPPRPRLT